jgi:radical SAM superfamily enzyme YgiQ (UPF0313 family)
MRICLVSAPSITHHGDDTDNRRNQRISEIPPLGILTLAAALERLSIRPVVIHLNRLYGEYLARDREFRAETSFCEFAASHVAQGFDVIALGTICSSYPLTLRLAARLKRSNPDAAIVLGGPQASAVDVATMESFPSIDIVVRGEADQTMARVLDSGLRPAALASVLGVTFRSPAGRIVRNPDAPLIADLDQVPFPAFHLIGGVGPASYVSLEIGRGCPFSCTFCSTSSFFRRRFRLKSPAAAIGQMKRLKHEYGVDELGLVHDMFTVDRRRVVEFCKALLDSGERFRWTCSARTDSIDEELLELMRAAGCRGLFFGIETGSPRLQKTIRKNLRLPQASARVASASRAGMESTVSLITGFPEETPEDLAQTIAFIMDTARWDQVETHFHILAPLAGTPLHDRFRGRLLLDEVYSDMSHQGWLQDKADLDLIAAYPDIFVNFYGLPVPALDRPYLKRLREFAINGLARFRWLYLALHQTKGGLLKVFEQWESSGLPAKANGLDTTFYYSSPAFRRDFTRFVRQEYLLRPQADPGLDALVRFEEKLLDAPKPKAPPEAADGDLCGAHGIRNVIPHLRPDVRLVTLDVNLGRIFEQLRQGKGLPPPEPCRVDIATRPRKWGGSDIIQLAPFSASFLALCDGDRTLAHIASELESVGEIAGMSVEQLCAAAFEELRVQRLLAWRRSGAAVVLT